MKQSTEVKVKDCLICSTPFTPERSTKKYCSDNCKQIAFYQRNGILGLQLNNTKDITTESSEPSPSTEQPAVTHISFSGEEPFNDKRESTLGSKFLAGKFDKTEYQPVRSSFIEAVADAIDEADCIERMFNDHFSPWSGNTREAVKKINIRLRSLLENLLLLSRQSIISRKTFVIIRNAFNNICGSVYFKTLPTDYPYTGFIKEIENICNQTAADHKKGTDFRLRLSLKRKIEFISVRFILSASTPFVSFHDLDFEDKVTLYPDRPTFHRTAGVRRRFRKTFSTS